MKTQQGLIDFCKKEQQECDRQINELRKLTPSVQIHELISALMGARGAYETVLDEIQGLTQGGAVTEKANEEFKKLWSQSMKHGFIISDGDPQWIEIKGTLPSNVNIEPEELIDESKSTITRFPPIEKLAVDWEHNNTVHTDLSDALIKTIDSLKGDIEINDNSKY